MTRYVVNGVVSFKSLSEARDVADALGQRGRPVTLEIRVDPVGRQPSRSPRHLVTCSAHRPFDGR